MTTVAATKQARIQDEKSQLHLLMQATAISHQRIRTKGLVTVLRIPMSLKVMLSIIKVAIVATRAGIINLRSPPCLPCATTRVVVINQVSLKPHLAIKEVMLLKIVKEAIRP